MSKNKTTKSIRQTTQDEYYQTRLAIIALLQQGLSGRDTARTLGVSDGYVSRIKKDFQQNGFAALRLYQRGKPWGNETHDT